MVDPIPTGGRLIFGRVSGLGSTLGVRRRPSLIRDWRALGAARVQPRQLLAIDLVKAESVDDDQLSLLSQLGVITIPDRSGALHNGARQWIYDCEER